MKRMILTALTTSILSCMPEQELPVRDMGEISGYFIECYCEPGQPYSLNATIIYPISNNIGEGYPPIDMSVAITADSALKLEPQFSSNLLVNFRHCTPLLEHGIDSLYLSIYTEKKEHITAKTAIPEEVTISSHSVSKENNSATITFQTSRNPIQNYYIFSVQAGSEEEKKSTTFLDLTNYPGGSSIEKTIKYAEIAKADNIMITLMRITKECYHYQISLYEANSANQGSISSPVPLRGNIQGALGIFTCYTQCTRYISEREFK